MLNLGIYASAGNDKKEADLLLRMAHPAWKHEVAEREGPTFCPPLQLGNQLQVAVEPTAMDTCFLC